MTFLKAALAVAALNTCALWGADFFPLQEGNTWTYREKITGQTFSVQVGQPATIAGNMYYKLTGYVDSDLMVRVEPVYGALMYWDDARQIEILLTSFEQFEGGHWIAPHRPCPEQDAQGLLKRGIHDGPAGPVADVLELQYRTIGCADVGVVGEQYAEHLGMLRRAQTSFVGPRVFDLISARIGKITIDAAPVGRFSVSVGSPAADGTAPATLRLQVSSPLVLSFTSGQEYDFALIDSTGLTLWRWSASRTFLQALHDRTVTNEWTASVDIPWPTAPGDYTVQAVVIAGAATPFSATVPVTIAAKQ